MICKYVNNEQYHVSYFMLWKKKKLYTVINFYINTEQQKKWKLIKKNYNFFCMKRWEQKKNTTTLAIKTTECNRYNLYKVILKINTTDLFFIWYNFYIKKSRF